MPDITISRAVARKLVDILEAPADAHPLVAKAIIELMEALDAAQSDTPAEIEIAITGTDMDLPD